VTDPGTGALRQKWSLTQEAFDGLLATLGPDRDSAAERYLGIRRNLVRFFEWRGAATPDEYADETINRCARKLGEGEQIRDLASYSIGVARMLFRESARERAKQALPLEEVPEPSILPSEPSDSQDARVACLRQCLAQLSPENRDLILSYYQDNKSEKIRHRKGLRQLFGIHSNTLRMRALRIRQKLQLCVEGCMQSSASHE
jgi:DNA-directed RNA polymerase specialized sigma24 family protein